MILDVDLQLTFLADLLIKSAILLVVGFVAIGLARRSAAAVRHRIWSLTFLSLLILPALSLGFPQVRFDVLPAAMIDRLPMSDDVRLPAGEAVPPPAISSARRADRLAAGGQDESLQIAQSPAETAPSVAVGARQDSSTPRIAPTNDIQEPSHAANWSSWTGLVWGLGFAVVFLPVLISLIRHRIWAASCKAVTSADALAALDAAKQAIGVRSRIRLLACEEVSMPMTWGVLFPMIVLPKDWSKMESEALRFTLLHELAHIKRWDVAQQLLARFASCIYWFNPACWIALRQLRFEREIACDDCVLGVGARAEDYASELVRIAKTHRPQTSLAGAAIAQSSELRVRIESLLDARRDHNPIDTKLAKRMAIAAIAFVVLLAGTKFGATAAGATQANNQDGSEQTDQQLRYAAIITDAQGRPVAGAKVCRHYWSGSALPDERFRRPIAITTVDGKFEFSVEFSEPERDSTAVHALLYVTAPGHGFVVAKSISYETTGNLRTHFRERGMEQLANLKMRTSITLPDGVPLRGQILDIEGQPVASAKVSPSTILFPSESNGDLDAWEEEAKTGKVNFYSLRNRLKLRSTLGGGRWLAGIAQQVVTDDGGFFELPGIGADRIVDLQVTGPGIEASQLTARTRRGETLQFPTGNRPKLCYANNFKFVAGPGGKLEGRVTDGQTGAPIAGVRVAAGSRSSRFGIGKPWLSTETDQDGRYKLEGYSLGENQRINVAEGNELGYLPVGDHVRLASNSPGLTRDFQLHKGHRLIGRAIHQNTGKPLTGTAHYYVAQDNPELKSLRDFASSMVDLEAVSDDDGEFELIVPKGIGLLGFVPHRDSNSFPRGVGADSVDIDHNEYRGVKIFHTKPQNAISSNECLLRQVNVGGDEPTEVELLLTSGESVSCRIVDGQGKPVTGCSVLRGQLGRGFYEQIEGVEFKVHGVIADTERRLFAFHRARGLGGTTVLRGADQPATITLLPLGAIQGRLVDQQGEPLSVYVNMTFGGAYAPGTNLTNEPGEMAQPGIVKSDENGDFKIEGLLPNYKYEFTTTIKGIAQPIAIDIELTSGETRDIGTVTPGKIEQD